MKLIYSAESLQKRWKSTPTPKTTSPKNSSTEGLDSTDPESSKRENKVERKNPSEITEMKDISQKKKIDSKIQGEKMEIEKCVLKSSGPRLEELSPERMI